MSQAGGSAPDTIVRPRPPVRAIVCAGGVETPYLRVGSGEPLVLLVPPPLEGATVEPLAQELALELALALASRFRVFVPSLPPAWEHGSWLRDFLDGVGVEGGRTLVVRSFDGT